MHQNFCKTMNYLYHSTEPTFSLKTCSSFFQFDHLNNFSPLSKKKTSNFSLYIRTKRIACMHDDHISILCTYIYYCIIWTWERYECEIYSYPTLWRSFHWRWFSFLPRRHCTWTIYVTEHLQNRLTFVHQSDFSRNIFFDGILNLEWAYIFSLAWKLLIAHFFKQILSTLI